MQSAIIEHVLPGRIRLRFPGQRGNVAFFEQVVALVSQHPAIEEARANPLTGSLLVRHSGPLEELGQAAVQMGLIGAEALDNLKGLRLPGARGWASLLMSQAPQMPALALAGLGLVQMTRGRVFGPASELLWHARVLWLRGMPQAALALGLIGLLQLSRANLFGSATSLLFYGLMLQDGRWAQWRRRM